MLVKVRLYYQFLFIRSPIKKMNIKNRLLQ